MSTSRLACTVAVAMQKGGVGKTTTTVHLARGAALAGLRTLVVDLDPQANATGALAKDPPDRGDVSIADALDPADDCSLSDVVIPTLWSGVELAPATGASLAAGEQRVAAMNLGRESRLRNVLAEVQTEYDLILLDCPPALGQLTVNALVASRKVLVVFEAEQFALDGLHMLRDTVRGVQSSYNPELRWAGVLVNRWRGTTTNQDVLDELGKNFTEAEIWPYRVPQWTGIGDAVAAATALDQWSGARFRNLAEQYTLWAQDLAGAVR
ncbi:ParA family protein [Pseudonocardia sp. ICBG162]|uniref:ParA family protein n=1 Tax=Pseudonocardia sp. ICBG162 TaxID=2846761 RepID=UPI001CF6FC57|nr:AAA family ATPase [Pseudonocardia sp. ICBG162]